MNVLKNTKLFADVGEEENRTMLDCFGVLLNEVVSIEDSSVLFFCIS